MQFNLVSLNNNKPIGACADTGAEISVISTAALKAANYDYEWSKLSSGHPIKGISPIPQESKTLVTKLKFIHDTTPLTVTVALSVIDSPDYRFLIGRDILRPLKYNISNAGLTLTNPKTEQTNLYEFATSSAFNITTDYVSINTAEPM